jgi:hypothetical protein
LGPATPRLLDALLPLDLTSLFITMSNLYFWVWTILALLQTISGMSVARKQRQHPLLLTTTLNDLRPTRIILSITVKDSDKEQFVGIPLRQRISAGTVDFTVSTETGVDFKSWIGTEISRKLKAAKIVSLVNLDEQAASLEQLRRITCRVLPSFTLEERRNYGSLGANEPGWPWFSWADENVEFEESSSRWFLAGREIESFECR